MKLSAFLFILLIGTGGLLSAQPVANHYTIFGSNDRALVPLNGEWQKIIDDETTETVIVPFRSAEASTYKLVKSVYIPDAKGKLLEFVSEGINHHVRLSINDQFVGTHQGGFFPFRIKIPREFMNTNKSIKVTLEIDERLSYTQTLPVQLMPNDPGTAFGFLGDVYLQLRPAVSVEFPDMNYSVNLSTNEVILKPSVLIQSAEFISSATNNIPENWMSVGAPVSVKYSVLNSNAEVMISDSRDVVIESDRQVMVDFNEAVFNPVLWSPETPVSYVAKVELSSNGIVFDKVDFPVGFRSVEAKGAEILINGKFVRMRGFTHVESYQSDKKQKDADIYRILKTVQQSGANAVRFAFYPPTQTALEICDSLGLLVFSQIPYFNVPSGLSTTKPIQTQSDIMLREMLNRDRVHPSLIAVGLASGLTSHHDLGFVNQLNESAKKINSSVLTFVVTMQPGLREQLPSVDLLGINVRQLVKEEFDNLLVGLNPEGRYFIASYGREIEPDNHNGYSDKQSQEFQAKYYMDRYKELKTSDKVSASFASTLLDYSVAAPRINSGNTDVFRLSSGVMNDDLTPRIAFTYLKNLYSNEITFNPPIGKYTGGIKVVFPIFGVALIFIFMFFFSSNRRFRDNMTRSFSRPFSFFSDIRDHRVILGLQTFGLVFLLSVTWALFFLSFGYGLRYSLTFDTLLSVLIPWPSVKELIIGWVWSPVSGVMVLSLIFSLMLGLFITFVVFLGWLVKKKITFTQSLICVIWSAAPSLCIVIVAMVFEQIAISVSWLVPYIFYFVIYLAFWSLWRMMKGIRIITVAKSGRVYTIGVLLIILVLTAVYFHYDYYYHAQDYVIHAFQAFK